MATEQTYIMIKPYVLVVCCCLTASSNQIEWFSFAPVKQGGADVDHPDPASLGSLLNSD